jgi:S-methylmethionine-dependent homocysteine/selenocysteine methylase
MGQRRRLPQLEGGLFLTDAGIETTLIFENGLELPCFAAFVLLGDEAGREALEAYYTRHAAIARRDRVGFILESATWRASKDWGERIGYDAPALERANREAIELLHGLRGKLETETTPMVVSGCVGPRGDGYALERSMSAIEADEYHRPQIRAFARAGADMVTAITMTHSGEAIGVARAASAEDMPVALAFTVETDGRLPSGQPLSEAIAEVDDATAGTPAYYMISCAHPTHFDAVLDDAAWTRRLRGLRANASVRSHAELDNAPDLDAGDPVDLGRHYAVLRARYPWLNVLGGCCGTDHRHIEQISRACRDTTI